MKFFSAFVWIASLAITGIFGQTPQFFYHNPANAGVNNLFFHTSVAKKWVAIYTERELDTAGVTNSIQVDTIWFRNRHISSGTSTTLTNFRIIMGHTTLTNTNSTFASNFNVGTPDTVLFSPSYTYNAVNGTFGIPANGWTAIPLQTPFTYNSVNNLAIQLEFTASSFFGIGFYASNVGPDVVYATTSTATTSRTTTSRPVFGLTEGITIAPQTAFGASDTVICAGECISFTDSSLNRPSAWAWTFTGSDSVTSARQNPSGICYSQPGIYPVQLITTNAVGSDTLVQSLLVRVVPNPSSSIVAPDTFACSGESLTFTASGSSGSYHWSQNGQNIGTGLSVQQPYVNPGNYTVQLITANSSGCTDTARQQVRVNATPQASFISVKSIICQGETLPFQNTSVGASNYTWLLNGAPVSLGVNPTISFTQTGNFNLVLVADSAGCRDTTLVTPLQVFAPPTADFTVSDTVVCTGEAVQFTNSSSSGVTFWEWRENLTTFSNQPSPSQTFNSPGRFQVNLIVQDGRCADTSQAAFITVNALPQVGFLAPGSGVCQNDSVLFSNTSSSGNYQWFVDGIFASSQQSPRLFLPNSGSVAIKLVVEDQGCVDSSVQTVTVTPGPQVNFGSAVGLGFTVTFTDLTAPRPLGWTWDFGDGSQPGRSQNPVHTYPRGGIYQVCLTVISPEGCQDSSCQTVLVGSMSLEQGLAGEVQIFPNPAHDRVEIQVSKLARQEVTARLLDLSGRVVRSARMQLDAQGMGELPLSGMAPGLYLVEIHDRETRWTRRLRVE
ncbi:MAG: PKD domain-containing protein [Bacteroidota bacterium]